MWNFESKKETKDDMECNQRVINNSELETIAIV